MGKLLSALCLIVSALAIVWLGLSHAMLLDGHKTTLKRTDAGGPAGYAMQTRSRPVFFGNNFRAERGSVIVATNTGPQLANSGAWYRESPTEAFLRQGVWWLLLGCTLASGLYLLALTSRNFGQSAQHPSSPHKESL